jgi:hypothetical protein
LALWTCKAKKCTPWIFFFFFNFSLFAYSILIFWMSEPKNTHN